MSDNVKKSNGKNICFILGAVISLLLEIIVVLIVCNNTVVYRPLTNDTVEILEIDYEEGVEDGVEGYYFYITVKDKNTRSSGFTLRCESAYGDWVVMSHLGVYDQIEETGWTYMLGLVTFAPPCEEVTAKTFISKDELELVKGNKIVFRGGIGDEEQSFLLSKLGIR